MIRRGFHQVLRHCRRSLCYGVLLGLPVAVSASGLVVRSVPATGTVDMVLVEKSAKTLYLLDNGQILRRYPIALGKNPVGHKQSAGDGRTPEGRYTLDWRNPDSRFYRSIHISYPNEQDLQVARAGNRDPGNLIMIHGSPDWVPSVEWAKQWLHKEDWTEGCIAVTNDIMDEIWQLVKDGTPIEIRP
ncbi:MAG: L,D-transpeptidase family protein [Porticoccaceae bacterium]